MKIPERVDIKLSYISTIRYKNRKFNNFQPNVIRMKLKFQESEYVRKLDYGFNVAVHYAFCIRISRMYDVYIAYCCKQHKYYIRYIIQKIIN